jgi:hypothetical protein
LLDRLLLPAEEDAPLPLHFGAAPVPQPKPTTPHRAAHDRISETP